MSIEIKTKLIQLEAGKACIAKDGDYVITAGHTISDVLRYLLDQLNGDYSELAYLVDELETHDDN